MRINIFQKDKKSYAKRYAAKRQLSVGELQMSLATNNHQSIKEILKGLIPFAGPTSSGDRLSHFFDRKL